MLRKPTTPAATLGVNLTPSGGFNNTNNNNNQQPTQNRGPPKKPGAGLKRGPGDAPSEQSSGSVLEHRISIFVNDPKVLPQDCEAHARAACELFGRIKSSHVPGFCKKGNLVFIEFFNRR